MALSWTQWRFPRSRDLITGRAVLVVSDGRLDDATMRRQRLSAADLLVSAREQGIRRTSDIEFAVLEADGRISFFTFEQQPQSGAAPKPPRATRQGPVVPSCAHAKLTCTSRLVGMLVRGGAVAVLFS